MTGYTLFKAITVPMARLVEVHDVMRTGNLTQRLNLNRHDEFGTLEDGFNRMTQELSSSKTLLERSNQELITSNERLAAERALIAAVLQNVAAGVVSIDPEGRIFVHSEIVPEHEHHGYGTQMVRAGLDDTRAAGIKQIGQCSMVRNFLAEHPDYTRLPSR